ncbi:hypothetical protein D210916BOD24_25050 [Alteromonas sp. D210916BOD_24]|uniref:hypothetical protein n=1 Tax=Alteromonas sp. D210916BOD_24 TaxID=3157618 RepID=UPI00399D0BD8
MTILSKANYCIAITCTSLMLSYSLPAIANDKASKSTDLNVDPSFDFSSHKRLTLEINVGGGEDKIEDRLDVRVYFLPEHKRPDTVKDAILFSGKTNPNGELIRGIEIPQHITALYIEVAGGVVPIEKEVIVGDSDYLVLQF